MHGPGIAAEHRRSARRGWSVVAGAFGVMFAAFGCTYCFSAFFMPLQDAFDASRAALSWIFSIAVFIYFLLGAVSGPLADRVGPRGMTLAGLVIIGAGLIVASQAEALWQVYLGYGVGVGHRGRLRLCAGDRRGSALVRAPARLRLGRCRLGHRLRHPGDAEGRGMADQRPRLARRLHRARRLRDRRRRPRRAFRRRLAAAPRAPARRRRRDRRGPLPDARGNVAARDPRHARLPAPVRRLLLHLDRAVHSVRAPRALCAGPGHPLRDRGHAVHARRRREHARTLLPRRRRRPARAAALARRHVFRRRGHDGVLVFRRQGLGDRRLRAHLRHLLWRLRRARAGAPRRLLRPEKCERHHRHGLYRGCGRHPHRPELSPATPSITPTPTRRRSRRARCSRSSPPGSSGWRRSRRRSR